MTDGVLSRVVNCDSFSQIWNTLDVYFAKQVRAKVWQYKDQLQNIHKISLSINEFLLKVRSLVDMLNMVGEIVSEKDYVSAILNGLSPKYEHFIVSVNTRADDYSVDEIEYLLLAQEACIEKNSKAVDLEVHNISNLAIAPGSANSRRFNGSNSGHLSYPSGSQSNFKGFSSEGSFHGHGTRLILQYSWW